MADIISNEKSVPDHIQTILNAFDCLDGPLPRQAILEAREHRDEIIPALLAVFRQEIETPEDQREFRSWLPMIAIYLLVEFRVKEALPLVLQSLHYSEQAIEDIYGDSLTEEMPGFLYYLGAEPDTLDSLIQNEELYLYVRWESLNCFYYFVRDGRMPKEELIDRFQILLQEMIEIGNRDMVSFLVSELVSCGAESAMPVIEQAYNKGLVDTFLAGTLESVQDEFRMYKPSIEKNLDRLDDYTDVIDTMNKWFCFQQKEVEPAKRIFLPHESKSADLRRFQNDLPDRPKQKIGRNDPCPCGSGKKFKKCCLKS